MNLLRTSNPCSFLLCLGIIMTDFSPFYLWRQISEEQASKSSKQTHLKHEVCTCCRFFPHVSCPNLQKGPATSNPLLRTKDNSFSCGITCVSHEKGGSPETTHPPTFVGLSCGHPLVVSSVSRWSLSLFLASRS